MRSTSEVYMHIVVANFYLLSVTGPKVPPDLKEDAERTVTSKAQVIDWFKRSLDAVKQAHLASRPKDLTRKVRVQNRMSWLTACISASSFMPTSTWGSWSPMRA